LEKHRIFWANTNFFETWRLIVGGSDFSQILGFDGLLITDCGHSFAFFNIAFVHRPLRRLEESYERAFRHFTDRHFPSIICFPPGLDNDSETYVVNRGHKPAAPHPEMTLFRIPKPSDKSHELKIRTVTDDKGLELFQTTAEEAFNMPFSLPKHLLKNRFRDHPAVSMFLGFVGDKPLSTSCLVTTGSSVAGIYWVSTLPDYRHRGYGTIMSWHAISAGEKLGCDMATLQASIMGRPVYEKMGFKVTADFRRYILTSEDETPNATK
jgi:GNAT superfamily N-acetyltransferase